MKSILYIIALLCLAMLFACSPERRLANLVKNHPGLIKTDSVHIRDTTIIKGTKTDTLFRNSLVRDTVVIRKDQLTMKYFYHNDTAFLSGECSPDTIIKDRIVKVNTIQPVKKEVNWWEWIRTLAVVAIAAFAIGRIMRNK